MTQILSDVRITDLAIVTAGAGATAVLGDFGADVIKIESPDRPDSFRGGLTFNVDSASAGGSAEERYPLRGPFVTVNRNKRAISVDLKTKEGVEIVHRLVTISDAVVENFRRGALERLGLGFNELVKLQEKIVLVTISSQGATGPNTLYGSFGSVLDALGGTASITGYDASTPRWSSNRVNFPDQLVSMYAPGMILAAIMAARESGTAKWIDLSQRELTTSVVGDFLLERSISGVDPVPTFNQGGIGLEWVSPSAGNDEWVAISIFDDDDWQGLCKALGQPDLAAQKDFRTDAARQQHAAEIERIVADWTRTRDKFEAMELLQGAGVPSAAVRSSHELHDDAYLKSIGFYHEVTLPPGRTELQRGFLVRFDDDDAAQLRRRAPFLGEHTAEVLTELLGYSSDDVERFMSEGIVS